MPSSNVFNAFQPKILYAFSGDCIICFTSPGLSSMYSIGHSKNFAA